jgi:hypothetical protein
MDNVSTKCKKLQIRIDDSDRKVISEIREIDHEFNISSFVRKSIREYRGSLLNRVGIFRIEK